MKWIFLGLFFFSNRIKRNIKSKTVKMTFVWSDVMIGYDEKL